MRNPNNKLGIKTLTDEQLRASLPNWEMIDYRLNSIREEAKSVYLYENSRASINNRYPWVYSQHMMNMPLTSMRVSPDVHGPEFTILKKRTSRCRSSVTKR